MLNAGKHVLVEKPFTLNAAQAREIVDLAASKGLLVLEAMWTRFLPHVVAYPRDHRRRHPRRTPSVQRGPPAEGADRPRAPDERPRTRGRRAPRSRHLPDLVRSAPLRHPRIRAGRSAVPGGRRGLAGRDDLPLRRRPARHHRSRRSTPWGPTWPRSSAPTRGSTSTPSGTRRRPSESLNSAGDVVESFDESVEGRGMQFQADRSRATDPRGRDRQPHPVARGVGVDHGDDG